jgi:hypothetical protein
VTIRYLHTVCLACNRAEGTVMCDLCSRLADAERDSYPRPLLTLVDGTRPTEDDADRGAA